MSTLRELSAESIGRITRRGLEPQLAQIEGALEHREAVVAVAPGRDGPIGIVVVLTARRVLISRGAPFAEPVIELLPRSEVDSASAAPEESTSTWCLRVAHEGHVVVVPGMFDRDAQRFTALLLS